MVVKIKILIKRLFLLLYYFGYRYKCPICNFSARNFSSAGLYEKRENAKCIKCGSLERHRIIYLMISELLKNKNGSSVLHFAPSKSLKIKLRNDIKKYYTSNFPDQLDADYNYNLENIENKNEEFDIIILNHVLEHVVEDRKAMNEIYRILKKNGIALICVPLLPDNKINTYENFTIMSPEDRIKHFGQFDHVRIYGLDIIDRLKECGFKVEHINYLDHIDAPTAKKFGLINYSNINEIIFKCQK